MAGLKLKRSPKIILQSVGIPTRPAETHNPGCVQIWIGKKKTQHGFKVLKVLKVTACRRFGSAAFWKPVKTGIEESVKRRATWTERNTIITLSTFCLAQFSMSTIKSLSAICGTIQQHWLWLWKAPAGSIGGRHAHLSPPPCDGSIDGRPSTSGPGPSIMGAGSERHSCLGRRTMLLLECIFFNFFPILQMSHTSYLPFHLVSTNVAFSSPRRISIDLQSAR